MVSSVASRRADRRRQKIGRLEAEPPEVFLGDDVAVFAGFVGVSGDGFVGDEVKIALDGKA